MYTVGKCSICNGDLADDYIILQLNVMVMCPGCAGRWQSQEIVIDDAALGLWHEAGASVELDKGDGQTHFVGDDCPGGHRDEGI